MEENCGGVVSCNKVRVEIESLIASTFPLAIYIKPSIRHNVTVLCMVLYIVKVQV